MANNIELTSRMDNNEEYPMNAFCTVDTSDPVGQKVVFNALSDALPLAQYMDTDIKVCDIMVEPGKRKNRSDGSYSTCMNTYLIDVDGNAYFSQSDGVFRSILNLMRIYRNGLRDTPNGYLTMRCVETVLNTGNTLKKLILV